MTTFRRAVWYALLLLVGDTLTARADDSAPSPEAINAAIAAGVKWLKSEQKEDGSWGPCVGSSNSYDGTAVSRICYRLGPTAFSIYTLAVCGVPHDDDAITRGVTWLRKEHPDHLYTSYESSAVILMLTSLNANETPAAGHRLRRSSSSTKPPRGSRFSFDDWRWMDDCVQHLVSSAFDTGGFGYGGAFGPSRPDVSATQFAILGLRAASFAGYPVEKRRADIWTSTAEFLRRAQRSSGGFPYEAAGVPSRGMTAAALSTLVICSEQAALLGEKEPPWMKGVVEKGMGYLDSTFDVTSNPSDHFRGRNKYHYCHLYAIERTGMLSGRHEFRGQDWYARGARFLVQEQYANDGHWRDRSCMDPEDVLGTCFALLFLEKATIPAITSGR